MTRHNRAGADLHRAYAACRSINARYGRTFFLATALLPPHKRPAVHALYAFARRADETVDDLSTHPTVAQREAALDRWAALFRAANTSDPVLVAVHDTMKRFEVPIELFDDFLASMRMDLTTSEYPTWADLSDYIHGSAAVIGVQMLHVLGTSTHRFEIAEPYARDLGIAFQLTNFLRDLGEDLRRGRVYLPKEDLAEFSVTRDDLAAGVVNGGVRRLIAFEIARTREVYRSAEPGIRLLEPSSRECVQTATTLYRGILDEIERADYQVLTQRVAVGVGRRVRVALPALIRANLTRRRINRG
ncbi:MAG TPA: phytoene/squalene synthase family protein [Mycobacteriales bacterium]|nr:phytoene/squalene synthase family protein [Mycobacteriales bacterium]